MGEVYRARDTRLDREVAIKTLPEEFEKDPDRIARFRREAKVLGSLNHPNIGAIYGLEKHDGRHFLVLELIQGETLADQIRRGPIAVDDALRLAVQLAEALQAAHEKGVVHRDLKPPNIKITHDGTVKVLDFGLAKAGEIESSEADILSNSPTLKTLASTPAMILGTAAYMSPEQAKGRPVDRRTDIFAFGCVLYEMLTGKRAFEGDDVSDTLAAVLRAEPNWDALPKELPPTIRILLKGCLEKDRRQRIEDISTALFLIKKLPEVSATSQQLTVPTTRTWKRSVALLLSLVGITISGLTVWNLKPSPPLTVARFSITLPEGQQFTNTGRHVLAISPDGTKIVYVANQQLYLRSISDSEVRPISGTQFQGGVQMPVFSPDGTTIAFAAARSIKRLPVTGGAAVTLCDAQGGPFGMNWNGDSILVGLGSRGVQRCPATGGPPEQLITVKDSEVAHGPQLLPGGSVLYTLAVGIDEDRWDRAKIVVESPGSRKRKILIDGGSDGRYLATGHLIYARQGVLYAASFDPEQLKIGPGVPVVEGVRRGYVASNPGTAHYMVSNSGTLIYVPGPASTTSSPRDLALMNKEGAVQALKLPTRPYEFPRFSPDGHRIAVGTNDGRETAVWLVDLLRSDPPRRLTIGGNNRFPIWTADGDRVAFQSDREGDLGIWWQRADGTGMAERLTKAKSGEAHVPNSWSPIDRDVFLFTVRKGDGLSSWAYSVKDKKATRIGDVGVPDVNFSPDGRWIAFSTISETLRGTPQGYRRIFLRRFPGPGGPYEAPGGTFMAWSSNGKQLFLLNTGTGLFNVLSVTTQPTPTFGSPTSFLRGPIITGSSGGTF